MILAEKWSLAPLAQEGRDFDVVLVVHHWLLLRRLRRCERLLRRLLWSGLLRARLFLRRIDRLLL